MSTSRDDAHDSDIPFAEEIVPVPPPAPVSPASQTGKKRRSRVPTQVKEPPRVGVSSDILDYIDEFQDFAINGPEDTGIASGIDQSRDPEWALPIGNTPKFAVIWAIHKLVKIGISDETFIRDYAAATGLIVRNRWYDEHSNTKQSGGFEEGPGDRDKVKKLYEGIKAEHGQSGVTVLTATKVNFWLTNHHVGSGRFSGYMKKLMMLKYSENVANDPLVFNAVWALGHWGSSAGILGALGVEGTGTIVGFKKYPSPADDVKMRIESYPAGTARVGVCQAIIKRINTSVFRDVLGAPPGLTSLVTAINQINQHKVKFHPGAYHLTGINERETYVLDEDLVSYCAAYIHAVMGRSTLAAAAVFPSKESVKDHIVYTDLVGLQTATVKDARPFSVKLEILAKRRAGATSFTHALSKMDKSTRETLGLTVDSAEIGQAIGIINSVMKDAEGE